MEEEIENNKIEKRKRKAKLLGMSLDEYEEWLKTKQKPKNVLLKERIEHLEFIQNNLLSGLDIKNKNIIELKKQNSSSSLKIIELEKYIKKTSEGKIRILQKKLEEKEIENIQEVKELKKELELTKKIKEKFKDFLLKEFFCGKEELTNRPLQWIIDLYYERKSTGEKSKQDILSNPLHLGSAEYLKSETCVCGNAKGKGAKGCKSCKVKQERIRKRENIAGDDAWQEIWKLEGKPQGKS